MKCAGKILLCLVSGMTCHAIARAADAALPNNPYASVVTRNVFGLNPPAPPAPPAPADAPPKITPNGILSILGHYQVLFKAVVIKPGQAAKDQSYILSEGQSQDDIEVTRIDEKNGIVTFNNHGTIQSLPLIATAASTGAAPAPSSAPAGGMSMAGRIPPPAAMANGGRFGANGTFGGRNPNLENRGNTGQPSQSISPEAQMILIAAQHAQLQKEGNPMAPLFPPTPIDPDAGVIPENGSTPPTP